MKKALITGFSGQNHSYLAELLLEKSYEVNGIERRASRLPGYRGLRRECGKPAAITRRADVPLQEGKKKTRG